MRSTDSRISSERLTDDARQAITLAQEESRAPADAPLGIPFGTEQLLLGLLRHEYAFSARVLHALGVTFSDVRGRVADGLIEARNENEDRKTRAERHLREDWRVPPSALPRPENLLEQALKQAEIFGHYYIGTPHLLVALLHEQEGVSVRTLRDLGVEAPEVRRTVMEMLRAGEYREKKRGGLHDFHRKGRKGISIRLELLEDERFAKELEDLLVLTGIVEFPDKNSSPPGLPSGQRIEPPEAPLGNPPSDSELAARIEQAVEQLEMRIEMMREDLLGLERAHRMLFELIDESEESE